MALTPERFTRKPETVEAVQVTEDNMAEVAAWCGGELSTELRTGLPAILIEDGGVALPGEWVTRDEHGYFEAGSAGWENGWAPADATTMTTWKRLDAEEVYGEFGWVTERPVEDAAYSFDPVEYRKQAWVLVSDEVDAIEPTVGYCQHEAGDGPCEDDDVTWQKDSAGHWIALCPKHLTDPVECPEARP